MLNFPKEKLYNAYLIETSDYKHVKEDIINFAVDFGFDKDTILTGNHPDFYEVECVDKKIEANVIKMDVIESSYYPPTVCEKKIYIIYDATNLSTDLQNAMLKTLEETPLFDIFFIITSNASRLLDTVKSRLIVLNDDSTYNYKELLQLDFADEVFSTFSNYQYESVEEIMNFASVFDKNEDLFRKFITLSRYIVRDALIYKTTIDKNLINLREKENEIISIANAMTMGKLGILVDGLNKLSEMKGLYINKKLAIYNYFMEPLTSSLL